MTMNAGKKKPMVKPPVSIRLDSPFERKDAISRDIDTSLSRLLVGGEYEALAELIHRCRPQNKEIFVHAIGQFVSLDKLLPMFDESGIESFTDYNFVGVLDKTQIISVFSRWNAEILVVFFADLETARFIIGSLPTLHPKWWKFSRESYEAPYLKQLKLADPFFFISPTRSSLEIIGSKTKVLECFDYARQRQ